MGHNNNIAIIIPAYKSAFLKEAVESVLCQEDDNFHVYIFNDASEDEQVESIINSFGSHLKLSYYRFENNLGRQSLPCHWNRCIEKTGTEQWIVLFSDDDIMDANCIRNFRRALQLNSTARLYRFNTIKFSNQTLLKQNYLPETITLCEWLRLKLNYQLESYVVEYIFARSLYERIGGFSDFPLGWCADDWFWLQAMQYTNLITISNSLVYWRYSNYNISGCKNTSQIAKQKMHACCLFIERIGATNLFRLDKNMNYLALKWIEEQLSYLRIFLDNDDISIYKEQIQTLIPTIT